MHDDPGSKKLLQLLVYSITFDSFVFAFMLVESLALFRSTHISRLTTASEDAKLDCRAAVLAEDSFEL